MSTGISTLGEIEKALEILITNGCKLSEISVLHCNSEYPTPIEHVNLSAMLTIKNAFNVEVGYSDHTLPNDMENIITATLLGAQVIEKHFTHNKSLLGNDHYHAMDKADLAALNKKLELLINRIGSYKKISTKEERISRLNARRSLYFTSDLKKGEYIKENHIIAKRPGTGISPKDIKLVLGKQLNKDVEEDELISTDYIK